jgi:N-methylhydantoinase B
LFVERLELSSAPGGEGRRRGGKGILLEYRVRGDGCFLTCAYTRSAHRPWGQDGGGDGSPNFVEVVRVAGGAERFAVATTLPLNEGDLIRIHTGNGGGFGPPEEREQEHVLADVRNGFASS